MDFMNVQSPEEGQIIEEKIQEEKIQIAAERLNTAIKLVSICSDDMICQYKNPITKGRYSHCTCGYTAPAIVIIMLFLEHYDIRDIDQLNKIHVIVGSQCVQLTRELFTSGVNQTVGYLWDNHYNLGVGVMHLIKQRSEYIINFKSHPQLLNGIYLVLFENSGVVCHNSTIYVIPNTNVCFITDSWSYINSNNEFNGRLPLIRKIPLNEVITALTNINNTTDIKITKNYMVEYFQAPNDQKLPKLNVYIVSQDFLKNLCQEKFNEGCYKGVTFGGLKPKKTKKTKKTKRIKRLKRLKRQKKLNKIDLIWFAQEH